jgi:hypothetical protein
MPKQPNVFVSMGTPFNDKQRAFRQTLINVLRSQGIVPRMLNETEYPPGNPLPHIRSLISECEGALIVAYERKHVEAGTEKRNSENQKDVGNTLYTTPWNHIESAIAYSLDKPLLMICEKGLRREGLIEDKLDWYVIDIEIDPAQLTAPEFNGRISAWRDHIRTYRSKSFVSSIDFTDLKAIRPLEVATRLTIGSWATLVGAAVFLIGIGFTLARALPDI